MASFVFILIIAFICMTEALAYQFNSKWTRPSSKLQYSVRVVNNKKKTDYTVQVPAGKIILDTAEAQGVSIPYSCRAGSCSSCIGKLKSGTIDQSGQIFLSDKQMDNGYVLTCAATATSDCEIEVDIEDIFYNENPEMVQ